MIELKNLTKRYPQKTVFADLNYSFAAGKTYALTGASGAGKSTLLNIIGRLESPTSGRVLVDGKDIRQIRERIYFRDYVGYLFQNHGLIENQTIAQNLALAFVGKKIPANVRRAQMEQALAQVNLNLDLRRKIYSLSGGEAQRVALAKLALKQPPIILADEPTAALDEVNSAAVVELLLQLVTPATTLIVATHTPAVRARMDEVLTIGK